MNLFIILVPLAIYIVNEYHQNKIFNCFQNIYKHRKIIMLISPFILLSIKPDILKKLLLYFHQIDESPIYQDMDSLMNSYISLRNQRNYNNNNINLHNSNLHNSNSKINIPNKNEVQMNNFQQQNNTRYNNNFKKQINPNSKIGSSNINLLQNPPPKKNKHKRNVSESKKKFIASNQKWKCAHCQQLFDNTFEVDHIVALYKGGSNELNNLEALCRNCHGKKTFMEKMGL